MKTVHAMPYGWHAIASAVPHWPAPVPVTISLTPDLP